MTKFLILDHPVFEGSEVKQALDLSLIKRLYLKKLQTTGPLIQNKDKFNSFLMLYPPY